jgi:hypothetical protein
MDDDDKGSAVSGWATPNSVGSAVERYQPTDRGKDLVSLTKEANRPRLNRGAERSRGSGKLRERGRQCRRGPS